MAECKISAAVPRKAQLYLAFLMGIVLLSSVGPLCAASQDPALCPYELGYSPTFSADGSQLFCNKAGSSESFLVDPTATNAVALRGVGASVRQLALGALTFSETLFCKYTDPNAVFILPDGTPTKDGDPKLGAFLFSFKFPNGVDLNQVFDVSNFQYLGGTPAKVHVDWRMYTLNFTVRFDVIFAYTTNESGEARWKQLYSIASYV